MSENVAQLQQVPWPQAVASKPPLNELAAALAKAQLEVQNPPLDSTNPHFKSRFASLPAVRNAIVPVFAKHGLAVTQDLRNGERGVACTTIVTHTSGQQMVFGPLEMPAMKADAQGLGSAATYARRYSLLAVACIAGDEDDDGNGATRSNGNGKAPTITEQQIADIEALIEDVGADREKFLRFLKVTSLSEIPASNYATVVKQLERKRQ